MKKNCLLLITLTFLSFSFSQKTDTNKNQGIRYHINLNSKSDDTFKVTVYPENLTYKNNLFQFAATAPGTYQTMDIGRYVQSFEAFDKHGERVETNRVSINQYAISYPERVYKINYSIIETWDVRMDSNNVYLMCGTSIENDHVMINGQAVFGFFKDLQSLPIKLKLTYPNEWKIGTALKKDQDGYYTANSFDHIVDSPILLGRLTKSSLKIKGTSIDIFTYSKTDKIKSSEILNSIEKMLQAANKFIDGFPVDNYTFLFHFEDISMGAWEHSYSSTYVYKEQDWVLIEELIKKTAAHEFFHIVTPLNIHSEIIKKFNFVTPIPSQHLWLYEGVTEWAADIMLLRDKQLHIDNYLQTLHEKALANYYLGEDYSLTELALTSYSKEGNEVYVNIYHRGALVATMLDIYLLELSNGKMGLRDVIITLTKKYGPSKPFNEKSFFQDFTNLTYPEIGAFFDKYVKGENLIPYKEYFGKVGINFIKSKVNKAKVGFGFEIRPENNKIVINKVLNSLKYGFKKEDIIKSINGTFIELSNFREERKKIRSLSLTDNYKITVSRGSKDIHINARPVPYVDKYLFELEQNPSSKQLHLRTIWLKGY